MNFIELKGIKKQFHNHLALAGIDITIKDGDVIALFGPNGAGKTTFLKIISGIMSPTDGEVLYFGESSSQSEVKQEIFFLGHKNSLYNTLTVFENMSFFYRLFSRNHGAAVINTVLKEHGLWERRNDPVNELSQGTKRRLALAKGFLVNSRIYILDEPFTGLDMGWRRSILSRIKTLKGPGKAVILSTHLVEEGFDIADIVAFLYRGKFLFIKEKKDTTIEEITGLFRSLDV